MLPRAYIVHQVRGRLRLRIREKCQDPDYFQAVCVQLESLDGVTDVSFNDATGSLLLLHPELPYAELAPLLQRLALFELVDGPEPKSLALNPVFEGFSWMNHALSEGSAGNVDLRSLAFIGLIGVAAQQLYRGNIAGPAIPMLLGALSLAQQINQSTPESDE
ncbi:MAG: HMA2 domain-containing protein [Pseudomonadota bacterium]